MHESGHQSIMRIAAVSTHGAIATAGEGHDCPFVRMIDGHSAMTASAFD